MKNLTRIMTAVLFILGLNGLALASGGGMGGGMMMSGGSGGGHGLVVADDGSVLIRDAVADSGGDGAWAQTLVNLTQIGAERWSVVFDEGWPMMISTAGGVVVVTLADAQGMGSNHGGGSGDEGDGGGGHMGGGGHGMGVSTKDFAGMGGGTLVALDLATGLELWRYGAENQAMISAVLTEDGSTVFALVREHGEIDGSSMHQGDSGFMNQGSARLVGLDAATGEVLFERELNAGSMGGGTGGMF